MFNTLQSLAEKGLFHQLSITLLSNINTITNDTLCNIYDDIILPNYYNINTDTFINISILVSKKLNTQSSINILYNTLNILNNEYNTHSSISNSKYSTHSIISNNNSTEHNDNSATNDSTEMVNNPILYINRLNNSNSVIFNGNIRILLEISLNYIQIDQLQQARIILYECKEMEIESKESLRILHLGLGLLNYKSKNFTISYKNLVEYLKLLNMEKKKEIENEKITEIIETVVRAGIYSDEIYSFTELIKICSTITESNSDDKNLSEIKNNEKFDKTKNIENISIKLITALENDDPMESERISKAFDEEIVELVKRKAVIIRLLNYFFKNQERTVILKKISDDLSLPLELVQECILQILGTGLMKGNINGISGEFSYTWIGYKYLTEEEIKSIRMVVREMRARVDSVRQEI
ncbi:hypothetical protein NEPAR06_2243 [Nematocida parisii]|uniref:PCI domain-containing protein n=1 Tax=Nematocida parisii (strain ERTm3) TaxID=935791 RepID=I3EDX5_NEMP3|nr:uncharacterized protein NEPG_00024 [Nematocida parisii ERTm1]EIJ87422.1 hypothetical protein NEQG_02303 [Nematocida parisii ERTm3]KAI5145375.1 hypothetical protein NEPAR07_1635 [Nematocida parisii]EIJ94502.1 hypothetical protein NEPG_00024 [Nematocida parisii ERTm1]KAI5156697.1 hypothetical protein NEPAR06_2243 [Nematocida parisii]KAI5157017.1 hypothetical protein NEPAR05_0972 [Nematocida parisii]|eukprot:XP_013057858.1 hypothetical protein NEPG_00024 [Nematocida parisii ERTm1]